MKKADEILLHTIRQRVDEEPELIGYIIAICAINMIDKPVLSAKAKQEFSELALSKLEKRKFKTFFGWKWTVKEK